MKSRVLKKCELVALPEYGVDSILKEQDNKSYHIGKQEGFEAGITEGKRLQHKADVAWLMAEDKENYTIVLGDPNVLIVKVRKDKWLEFVKEVK